MPRCASFNVLADAYLGYGNYSHVAPSLLGPGARIPHLVRLIASLQADIVGLQEVEKPLVDALRATGDWQLRWSPKEGGRPDGCLMLIRNGITATDFETHPYSDGTGHVMQSVVIGDIIFVNTHLKYPPDQYGVPQIQELLGRLGKTAPAVIFADCNDRPGGPVRALVEIAGFTNSWGHVPTARIGEELAALDLLAARGVYAERIALPFSPEGIPNEDCPSDHAPVMAHILPY
jgi:hypothetical protein